MGYVPRTADEILQSLAGRFVARSNLLDLAQGSIETNLLRVTAEELEGAEIRLKRLRDSFFLAGPDLTDADLDERVAELPPGFEPRRAAVAATGDVMRMQRIGDSQVPLNQVLEVPAGTTFRGTNGILYRVPTATQFGANVSVITNVRVTAASPGKVGNADAGTIHEIVTAPQQIIAASNTIRLTNGLDVETSADLRARAIAYLGSLARALPRALEYAALAFVASDNTRVRFARIFEDPLHEGYSELVVDDGSGMAGLEQPGGTITGTVPANGQVVLWHESPATEPITSISVLRASPAPGAPNPETITAVPGTETPFVSLPERGLLYMRPGVLAPGDVWTISGYDVFVGILAELQRLLEGDVSDPAAEPGWIGSGLRVRVLPPLIYEIGYDVHIVPAQGTALADVALEVEGDIIAFHETLGPGQTLFVSALIAKIMANPNVMSVRLFEPASNPIVSKADVSAPSARHVLRTSPGLVNVIPAPEG